MSTADPQDGLAGLIFILVMLAVSCVIVLIWGRRREPELTHRRGSQLLNQNQAQARANGTGGNP